MPSKKNELKISYVPEEKEDYNINDPKLEIKKTKTNLTINKLHEKLKKQEKLFKKVAKERDELKDKYLRNLAEIDNFRKRMNKEKENYHKYILSEFLINLLEIFDNLERALNSQSNSNNNEKSIFSGITMIHKQLIEFLKKHNTVEMEALGKPFDPNFHQALSKEERHDIKEPIVVKVYQKGFIYNGKLLRPSLVKVAVPVKTEKNSKEKL
jgi:molecular chaperone GrpE